MKYSVIYISTSPEGFEKISVGLIVVVGDKVEVRTSDKKIAVAKLLLTEKEYQYVALAVKNYEKTIKTEGDVEYLSRYSNNIIQFSPLKTIDVAPTKESMEWIYNRYLFRRRPQEEKAFV